MMSNVTYKKLGEVAIIHDSRRKPVTKADRKAGVYPYYGATGIQDYVDNYIFDGRYLLVGEDGAKWGANDKSAYIIEGKSWVNNHAHVLSFKEGIVDSFVAYYLNYQDLDSFISGAIVRKLTQKALLAIPLPVPSLEDQQRIVRELDAIHAILDAKKEQLRELDKLAEAIFYDMFGDPASNEKGWKKSTINDACSLVTDGSHYSPKASVEGIYPMLSVKDMQRDMFDYSSAKMIDESEYQKLVNMGCRPDIGDVLVAKDGSYFKYIFCVKEFKEQALLSSIAILRPENHLNSEYLRYFLSTNYIYALVEQNYISGSALKRVILKGIKKLPLLLPPLDLQQAFASKISAIEQQKERIRLSLRETEALLAARMQHYFD